MTYRAHTVKSDVLGAVTAMLQRTKCWPFKRGGWKRWWIKWISWNNSEDGVIRMSLMMLDIFLCACLSFVNLLCWRICSNLRLFLKAGGLSKWTAQIVENILWTHIFSRLTFCTYFLLFCVLPFHRGGSLKEQRFFSYDFFLKFYGFGS